MKLKTSEGQTLTLRKISDDDYLKLKPLTQGTPLDVCPTCGGREEYIVPGIKQFVPKKYKLGGKEHECDCRVQMALRVRYLQAGIGSDYWPLRWENFKGDPKAKEAVDTYLEKWEGFLREGMGLMFSSPIQGVGKTWGAAHIGKELIKHGQKVFFINFQTMVNLMVQNDAEEVGHKMSETTFLILDEIKTGISDTQTSFFANQFESVIRHRTMFNLPTLATTNLTKPQFESHFDRIGSLLDAKQIWLDVSGADYRRSQEIAEEREARILEGEAQPIV